MHDWVRRQLDNAKQRALHDRNGRVSAKRRSDVDVTESRRTSRVRDSRPYRTREARRKPLTAQLPRPS